MFGDYDHSRVAELLLRDFTLEEILEMNSLEESDVLGILIEGGKIEYPEGYVEAPQ